MSYGMRIVLVFECNVESMHEWTLAKRRSKHGCKAFKFNLANLIFKFLNITFSVSLNNSSTKMATFRVIFVLLVLNASTIVNVAGFWGKIKPPFPFPKLPAIPKPKPTPKPTEAPAFSPVKDSKYCDESELEKLLSKEERKKRAVSLRVHIHNYVIRNRLSIYK